MTQSAESLPDYTACSFALGRGLYCKGDVRFPHTHSTLCPRFSTRVTPPEESAS